MIITLRTLPRDDGRTSVILTRDPGDPRDPEVVNVLPNSRAALRWLMDTVSRISAQAGDKLKDTDATYRLRTLGTCSAVARLEIELGPGEELVVR